MKVGDMVRVHVHLQKTQTGIIIKAFGFNEKNRGRAWHLLMDDGKLKTKLAKDLEVIKDANR
tara:strand:+ start:546 stop:731 length:186 start_codon:yes stop_codon:yes gene_type:complete